MNRYCSHARMRQAHFLVLLCGLALFVGIQVLAQDTWPRFRGPQGTGLSDEQVPTRWSERHNVRWKTPLPGRGWSSPVVGDGRIWMTTATDEGHSLRALCVDLDSGQLLHDVEVFRPAEPEVVNAVNSRATPTPVLGPGRVYVSFGSKGTACLDSRTADVLWTHRELRLDHKEGAGSSPILWNGLLILECDGIDEQYIAALDAETGKEVWRSQRSASFLGVRDDQRKAYGTPVVLTFGDEHHLVSCGSRRFYGYDPTDGSERWVVDHGGYNCAQVPVTALGNVLLGTGWNRGALMAVRVTRELRGNVTDSNVMWTLGRDVPRMPSPLVLGDRIFMISDGGVATWVDAENGRQLWRDKVLGKVYASPVAAGEHIIALDDRGQSVVFKRGEPLEAVGTNQLAEGCMATPAVVDGSLIVRTKTHLYRIQER